MGKRKILLGLELPSAQCIGLLNLKSNLPSHEAIFHLNQINPYPFYRINDLVWEHQNNTYNFAAFEAKNTLGQVLYKLYVNQSFPKNSNVNLFLNQSIDEVNYLLKEYKDAKFIVVKEEHLLDFDAIRLPDIYLPIKQVELKPKHLLNQLIEHHE
jgi:hypothetical protein